MIKNYVLIALLFFFSLSLTNAQVSPESLGSSSSDVLIHFKINPGTCADYPASIIVEGSTFDLLSCSGINLKYELTSGNPLPFFDTFTVNLGIWICDYLDGELRLETLSSESFSKGIKSLRIHPNPITNGSAISLIFAKAIRADITLYDLTGKMIINDVILNSNSKTFSTADLDNGIYLLQVISENKSVTRKVVVMR